MKGSENLAKEENQPFQPPIIQRNGKKVMILNKIKKHKDSRKKGDLAKKIMNNDLLCKFNGTVNNDQKSFEKSANIRIESLIKAQKRILELYEGCNRKDIKEINELAQELLTPEELESAIFYAKEEGMKQYVAKLAYIKQALDTALLELESGGFSFSSDDKKKTVHVKDLTVQIKAKLNNEIKEEMNIEAEDSKDKEDAQKLEKILKGDEEVIKDLLNEEEEKPKEPEKAPDGLVVDESKLVNMDANDDAIFNEILGKIEKGEIKLDAVDKNQRINSLNNEKAEMNTQFVMAESALEAIDKLESVKDFELFTDENKHLLLEKSVRTDFSVAPFLKYMSTQKLTKNEMIMVFMIKNLTENLSAVKTALDSVIKMINNKVKIDDKIQMQALKSNQSAEATQIKKIIKSSYIPDSQWKKMSSVQKAVKQVKDWDQFPKYSIWTSYNEQNKIDFLKERVKWNIARLDFLANLAAGYKPNNPENWNTEINVGTALTNQLYYADRYMRGSKCKEWDTIYKKLDQNLRTEYYNIRSKCRAILKNLANQKKLTGFVYCRNVRIPVNNKCYWEIGLEKIAEENIKKYKESGYVEPIPVERGRGRGGRRGDRGRGRGRGAPIDGNFM